MHVDTASSKQTNSMQLPRNSNLHLQTVRASKHVTYSCTVLPPAPVAEPAQAWRQALRQLSYSTAVYATPTDHTTPDTKPSACPGVFSSTNFWHLVHLCKTWCPVPTTTSCTPDCRHLKTHIATRPTVHHTTQPFTGMFVTPAGIGSRRKQQQTPHPDLRSWCAAVTAYGKKPLCTICPSSMGPVAGSTDVAIREQSHNVQWHLLLSRGPSICTCCQSEEKQEPGCLSKCAAWH